MTECLMKYQEMDLEIYLIVNKAYWDKYEKMMQALPFKTKFVDPATPEAADFIHEIVVLNEKAYGAGMAAPDWTFANFGTIGAGITAGFLSNGKPVSQLSLIGNISDPAIAHEWTLLVDPELEGQAIGTLTYALVLHLAQEKDYITFIMQTDNSSVNIYLKHPYPLMITAYGFVHTRQNSMMMKTKIPKKDGFDTLLKGKIKQYSFEDYPEAKAVIPSDAGCFWLCHNSHELYQKINEDIAAGSTYSIIGKTEIGTDMYLLIEKG